MINKTQETILTKESLNNRIQGLEEGQWRNNKGIVINLKDQPVTYLYNIYKMILRSAENIMHEEEFNTFCIHRGGIMFATTSRQAVVMYAHKLWGTVDVIENIFKLKGSKNLIIAGFIDPAP
jgi:hypothetical protein